MAKKSTTTHQLNKNKSIHNSYFIQNATTMSPIYILTISVTISHIPSDINRIQIAAQQETRHIERVSRKLLFGIAQLIDFYTNRQTLPKHLTKFVIIYISQRDTRIMYIRTFVYKYELNCRITKRRRDRYIYVLFCDLYWIKSLKSNKNCRFLLRGFSFNIFWMNGLSLTGW